MPGDHMDSSSCQAVTQPTMYCRKCWYILDGLDDPRCPECGRAFDPANRRTYRTRPRRQWWSRVLLRVMVVMMLVVAIPAGFLYRRYRIEHRAMAALQTRGFRYRTAPYGPEWLTKWATQRGLPMVEVVVSVPEMFHSDTISSDWNCACQCHFQQHDHFHHGSFWQSDFMVICWESEIFWV